MRIVFMGSAELACRALETLTRSDSDELAAVITQPDRPKGRHLHFAPCPAKAYAERKGARILTPPNVNAPESLDKIRALHPDLLVVVAYGQILRRPLLDTPAHGCVNLHSSLLPKYRGAAPIQWAIANGDTVTGVTSMFMNERMDAGDIIFQDPVAIGPDETAGELHDRLAQAGAALLERTIDAIRTGTAPRQPQDERLATPAPKLSRKDGRIRWTMDADDIYNRIRGFDPWPGSFCRVPFGDKRQRLKVLKASVEASSGDAGAVLEVEGAGPLIGTAKGALRLLRVQPEGGRSMQGNEYLRGHTLAPGDRLD